jgi:phosphate transport system substrate-binding protein
MSRLRAVAAAILAFALAVGWLGAVPAHAAGLMTGAGSTYAALAIQQWIGDAKRSGLNFSYNTNGSPAGVQFFLDSTIDFAATEAEIASVNEGSATTSKSYQYIPDVAGATAFMYNLHDTAGRQYKGLKLTRDVIAGIFTGEITSWNDPAITSQNGGIRFQEDAIKVVIRSERSGTTGLFYDFVQNTAPARFARFKQKQNIVSPDGIRIIQIPTPYPANWTGIEGSDKLAQTIASSNGSGMIGYDEFGYAIAFGAQSAWVQNASGNWVQPYAANISKALESAQLRPDLTQDLRNVYKSTAPQAYPVSAYSYIMTPCAPAADRNTCKTPYYDDARAQQMAKWLDYIACDGQVKMAQIGYSPLPTNLSQEIQNSITRMSPKTKGRALNGSNCRNPQFHGNLGAGATGPPPPNAAKKNPSATPTNSGSPGASPSASAGAGSSGTGADAVGGGSGRWRDDKPVAYGGLSPAGISGLTALLLLLLVGIPPLVAAFVQRIKSRMR